MNTAVELEAIPKTTFRERLLAFVDQRATALSTRITATPAGRIRDEYESQLGKILKLKEACNLLQSVYDSAASSLITVSNSEVTDTVNESVKRTGWSTEELNHELGLLFKTYQSPMATNVTPERVELETRALVRRATDDGKNSLSDKIIDEYVKGFLRRSKAVNAEELLLNLAENVIIASLPLQNGKRDISALQKLAKVRRELVGLLCEIDGQTAAKARVDVNAFEEAILNATYKHAGIELPITLPDH